MRTKGIIVSILLTLLFAIIIITQVMLFNKVTETKPSNEVEKAIVDTIPETQTILKIDKVKPVKDGNNTYNYLVLTKWGNYLYLYCFNDDNMVSMLNIK